MSEKKSISMRDAIAVCLLMERHKRKVLLDECIATVLNNQVTVKELAALEDIEVLTIDFGALEKVIQGYGMDSKVFFMRCLGLQKHVENSVAA